MAQTREIACTRKVTADVVARGTCVAHGVNKLTFAIQVSMLLMLPTTISLQTQLISCYLHCECVLSRLAEVLYKYEFELLQLAFYEL